MGDVQARWISIRDAAAHVSVSPKTFRSWCADGIFGRGVVARIHRRNPKGRGRHVCTVRIDKSQLDRWLSARAR
jgi:hypothetical protein